MRSLCTQFDFGGKSVGRTGCVSMDSVLGCVHTFVKERKRKKPRAQEITFAWFLLRISDPCTLKCRKPGSSSPSNRGRVKDGARCSGSIENLNVCIDRKCKVCGDL